jgi:hypothetical protein
MNGTYKLESGFKEALSMSDTASMRLAELHNVLRPAHSTW